MTTVIIAEKTVIGIDKDSVTIITVIGIGNKTSNGRNGAIPGFMVTRTLTVMVMIITMIESAVHVRTVSVNPNRPMARPDEDPTGIAATMAVRSSQETVMVIGLAVRNITTRVSRLGGRTFIRVLPPNRHGMIATAPSICKNSNNSFSRRNARSVATTNGPMAMPRPRWRRHLLAWEWRRKGNGTCLDDTRLGRSKV